MLPVPINMVQTAIKFEKKIPTNPIIIQTIMPANGVARNLLLENSILCSSRVLMFILKFLSYQIVLNLVFFSGLVVSLSKVSSRIYVNSNIRIYLFNTSSNCLGKAEDGDFLNKYFF